MFRNLYRQYKLDINTDNEHLFIKTTTLDVEHPNFNDQFINLLYNASDIGINTSMGESWGLVTFEQAGIARPQIITNFSAPNEIFDNCKGVYKVKTSDFFIHPLTVQSAMGQGRVVNYKDVAKGIEHYYRMTNNELIDEGKGITKIVFKYKWPHIGIKLAKSIQKIKDEKIYFDEDENEILSTNLDNMKLEIKDIKPKKTSDRNIDRNRDRNSNRDVITDIITNNELKKNPKDAKHKTSDDLDDLDDLDLDLEFDNDVEIIMS